MWLEELDAQTVAEVRAFDEAGQVSDGEGFGVGKIADLNHPEVGLKGGEGVVGDFGPGGGEARDEGGLADVGVANQTGVSEQTEFEAIAAFFARAAKFVLAWSLVGAGGEVLVAAAAASPTSNDNGLAGMGEVVDEFAGGVVVKESADGNLQRGGLAGLAGAVGAEAVARRAGLCVRG